MRLRHQIHDHNKPDFTAALDALGIHYKTNVIGGTEKQTERACFELSVYDDDRKWPALRDLATKFDVRVFTTPFFSTQDIQSAPWLFAHAVADAGYPQPEKQFGYRAASYDLTHYCERCGIGKIQNRPIRLRSEPKSKSSHFFAPQWTHQIIFARQEVRQVFETNGVSGINYLAPLKHRTGVPLDSIVQILPTKTAKDGLVVVVQEQVTCKPDNEESRRIRSSAVSSHAALGEYCGRIKYQVPYRRRLVHYHHAALQGAPDFVLSAEWFGSGAAASQQIIVSNKVAKLVIENKWKGLEFEPVQIL